MLTTVIIDDDEIAIKILENLLKRLTSFDIHIVGKALSLDEGVALINKLNPDLVFLDINMPGKTGLEIFNEFTPPDFKIIFCTAFQQYAIDVLRIAACGYLLKPLDFMELRDAVQKVSLELQKEQKFLQLEDKINSMNAPEMHGENIVFDTENGFIMLNTRNIEYCYANISYSYVVSYANKEIIVSKSLKELQEMMPANQFYRTHKSYFINIYYIRKFLRAKESYVLLKSGTKIPVSVRVASSITKDIIKMLHTE
jgi:two-component system, LytTR family, response regulator